MLYYDIFTEQFLPTETPRPPSRLLHMLRNRSYASYMLRRAFSLPWLSLPFLRSQSRSPESVASCGCFKPKVDEDNGKQYRSPNSVDICQGCKCPCHSDNAECVPPMVVVENVSRPCTFGGKVWHKRKPTRNPCPWIQPLGRASTAPPMSDYSTEMTRSSLVPSTSSTRRHQDVATDNMFDVLPEHQWCQYHGWVLPRAFTAEPDFLPTGGNVVDDDDTDDADDNDTNIHHHYERIPASATIPAQAAPQHPAAQNDDMVSLFNEELFGDYVVPITGNPNVYF